MFRQATHQPVLRTKLFFLGDHEITHARHARPPESKHTGMHCFLLQRLRTGLIPQSARCLGTRPARTKPRQEKPHGVMHQRAIFPRADIRIQFIKRAQAQDARGVKGVRVGDQLRRV